jgi:uncharacterized protein (UPF0261 family)
MATVVLVGSLDTKGAEYRYARDQLQALGVQTVVVDTGTVGKPGFAPDVTASAVAAAAGCDLDRLRNDHDRAAAVEAMGRGATAILQDLRGAGRLDGVFALGGSGNTTVASAAFRSLPLGIPKLIVSTMTSGNTRLFVGESDLVLAASVVDIAGLNRISRVVIANGAAAVVGMVDARATRPPEKAGDRPLVAASMIGLTTRAVAAARERLEASGYEVLVFHMTGAGGQTMESLIDRSLVVGVLDLTTSELADELGGGVCSAGPDRLRAAARRGIPQVVAPGGLDMINFGAANTVPKRYAARTQHVHNSAVTLVRADAAESAELGRMLVDRITSSPGSLEPGSGGGSRPVLLLPSGGLSAIDVPGSPFHDADADRALVSAARAAADPKHVRVVDVKGDVDDPAFGIRAADLLLDLMADRPAPVPV